MVLVSPHTRFVGDDLHGRTPVLKPAWVDLDVVFTPDPGEPRTTVPDGLDRGGSVRGLVSGWFRWSTGSWLAVVNYSLGYADGRGTRLIVPDQLVPARAVRPREDNRPL